MAGAAICFMSEDGAYAMDLARYLEFHTSQHFDLAECRRAKDFLDGVEQCLLNELLIVVLSPAAVPAPWPRPEWERVFLEAARDAGSQLAYLLREECAFPKVLRRRNFFESDFKALRRWTIQQATPDRVAPDLALAGTDDHSLLVLLEEPGVVGDVSPKAAAWFAKSYWSEFEAVYWVDFLRRTWAGVLGELAQAMQLRLAGTVDQNWQSLKKTVGEQRALFIFQNLSAEWRGVCELGGKASILLLSGAQDSADPWNELQTQAWPEIYANGMRALFLLKQQARLAEAHELLVWMSKHARQHGDLKAWDQIRWEESWILDAWDLPVLERTEMTRTQPSQLWLPIPIHS